ncbi:MAG: hypothetical protein WCQ50_21945 [Spirochaetota bacterium]
MTQARFRELSSTIVSHAAQLVYNQKNVESYRLLSAADRLFRCLADPAFDGQAPLSDEISLASSFLDVLRIIISLDVELVVDLDEEARSASFVTCGSLVDLMDALIASNEVRKGPIRIFLVEDGPPDRGLFLVMGNARQRVPAGPER